MDLTSSKSAIAPAAARFRQNRTIGRMLAMNIDSLNELPPPSRIRRSWTGLIAFLRNLEPDYSEADYILERVSRLERDFAEFKQSLSEKDAATSIGGLSLSDVREDS